MRSNRGSRPGGRATRPSASGRALYYSLGLSLSLLSLAYCAWVFRAGQYQSTTLGSCFVMGVPNYYKYVVIAITTLAGAFTSLAYFTPELLSSGGTLLQELGWGYGAATLLVLALALYFVTDHFITSHELDAQVEPAQAGSA